jgi:hypothetical protein
MTAKTLAQRSASYRQRKAERVARLERVAEEATAAILERDAGGTTLGTWAMLRAAVHDLNAD